MDKETIEQKIALVKHSYAPNGYNLGEQTAWFHGLEYGVDKIIELLHLLEEK